MVLRFHLSGNHPRGESEGSDALLPILKGRGVFPYTVFDRDSVLTADSKTRSAKKARR